MQTHNIKYILKISKKITTPKEKFITKFHKCYLCGGWLNPYTTNVDHIIPKSSGGLDVSANKKLVHTRCNLEKGAELDMSILEKDPYVIAHNILSKESSKVRTILIKKCFPEINLSRSNADVLITLSDYKRFIEECKVYKLEFTDTVYAGYVPLGSKALKFNNGFSLSNYEIKLMTAHLIKTLFAGITA